MRRSGVRFLFPAPSRIRKARYQNGSALFSLVVFFAIYRLFTDCGTGFLRFGGWRWPWRDVLKTEGILASDLSGDSSASGSVMAAWWVGQVVPPVSPGCSGIQLPKCEKLSFGVPRTRTKHQNPVRAPGCAQVGLPLSSIQKPHSGRSSAQGLPYRTTGEISRYSGKVTLQQHLGHAHQKPHEAQPALACARSAPRTWSWAPTWARHAVSPKRWGQQLTCPRFAQPQPHG